MTGQQRKPSGQWVVDAVLVIGFLVGVGIAFVGVRDLLRGASLGDDAVTLEARVTDTRVMTSRKRGETFEVKYAFEVAGATYSYNDSTGRTDLWVPLEREAWESARAKGTTPVSYLPSDPWNNRPLHHADEPIFGRVAGIFMGLLCMAPATMWGFAAFRRRRG